MNDKEFKKIYVQDLCIIIKNKEIWDSKISSWLRRSWKTFDDLGKKYILEITHEEILQLIGNLNCGNFIEGHDTFNDGTLKTVIIEYIEKKYLELLFRSKYSKKIIELYGKRGHRFSIEEELASIEIKIDTKKIHEIIDTYEIVKNRINELRDNNNKEIQLSDIKKRFNNWVRHKLGVNVELIEELENKEFRLNIFSIQGFRRKIISFYNSNKFKNVILEIMSYRQVGEVKRSITPIVEEYRVIQERLYAISGQNVLLLTESKAIEGIKQIENESDEVRTMKFQGYFYIDHERDIKRGIECWKKTIELSPSDIELSQIAGKVAFNNKMWDEAIYFFENCVNQNHKNINLVGVGLLPLCYYNAGKSTDGLKFFIQLQKEQPNNMKIFILVLVLLAYNENWREIGELLEKKGDYKDAREFYLQAIKINESDDVALFELGFLIHMYEHEYENALQYYDKSIRLNPKAWYAWNMKGIALGSLNKNELAIECFNNALKIKKDARVWHNKGNTYFYMEKLEDALLCFKEALKLQPDKVDSKEYMKKIEKELISDKSYQASLLWLKKGHYKISLNCLESSLKVNPKKIEAWFQKGFILFILGKYMESDICYLKASIIEPSTTKSRNIKKEILKMIDKYFNFS